MNDVPLMADSAPAEPAKATLRLAPFYRVHGIIAFWGFAEYEWVRPRFAECILGSPNISGFAECMLGSSNIN